MAETLKIDQGVALFPSLVSAEIQITPPKIDGRRLKRKSVGDDKTTAITDIADNSITQAMLQDAVVGKAELKYEEVTIAISGTSTSGTATVTSGSVPAGYYLSTFSGAPAASHVQLGVSGTTLTATLSTAPGAGTSITIKCLLIKA